MKVLSGLLLATASFLGSSGICQEMILAGQLQAQKSSATLIDVRTSTDFQRQHIDGAVNIPKDTLSSVGFSKDALLVVYCNDVRCPLSHEAAKTLVTLGFRNVKVLYGGIAEWRKQGLTTVPLDGEISDARIGNTRASTPVELAPIELWNRLQRHDKMIILDLRPAREFSAGHLPGATSAPLEQLADATPSLSKTTEIVVYDRLPERSCIGAKQLTDTGFTAHALSGGVALWARSGYPLNVGMSGK